MVFNFFNAKIKKNSISKIACKAKIKGDKLPKITNFIGRVSKKLRLTSYWLCNDRSEDLHRFSFNLLAWTTRHHESRTKERRRVKNFSVYFKFKEEGKEFS